MMENFTNILQQLPMMTETPSTRNHFRDVTPFEVKYTKMSIFGKVINHKHDDS